MHGGSLGSLIAAVEPMIRFGAYGVYRLSGSCKLSVGEPAHRFSALMVTALKRLLAMRGKRLRWALSLTPRPRRNCSRRVPKRTPPHTDLPPVPCQTSPPPDIAARGYGQGRTTIFRCECRTASRARGTSPF